MTNKITSSPYNSNLSIDINCNDEIGKTVRHTVDRIAIVLVISSISFCYLYTETDLGPILNKYLENKLLV